MTSGYTFLVGHLVLFPIAANEDTELHAVSAWNIGRVAYFLELMTAAIVWIVTGNAHYQTPHIE